MNNISPDETILLAGTISLALSKDRSADEINVIGNLIVTAGSFMLTIAAQQQALVSSDTNNVQTPNVNIEKAENK